MQVQCFQPYPNYLQRVEKDLSQFGCNPIKTEWVVREAKGQEPDIAYLKCKCISPLFNHYFRMNYFFVSGVISDVFNKIMTGRAGLLLGQKSGCENSPLVMGECSYTFGSLRECACLPLDRKKFPDSREKYESSVISMVKALLTDHPERSEFTITTFASGYLFSDLVLMVKLLQSMNWKGKIRLVLIDTKYKGGERARLEKEKSLSDLSEIIDKRVGLALVMGTLCSTSSVATASAIEKKSKIGFLTTAVAGLTGLKTFSLFSEILELKESKTTIEKKFKVETQLGNEFLGTDSKNAEAMQGFLNWVIAALPASIELNTYFFGSDAEYLSACKQKKCLKPDILIGADVEDCVGMMIDIKKETGAKRGVILLKEPALDSRTGNTIAVPKQIEWSK